MSKGSRNARNQPRTAPQPPSPDQSLSPEQVALTDVPGSTGDEEPEDVISPAKLRAVPVYRQCPLCYGGRGGRGKCYKTAGAKRYYRCVYDASLGDRGGCGHTWTAEVQWIRIEHRAVNLSER